LEKKKVVMSPDQYTEPSKEHVPPIRSRLKGKMHLRGELDLPVKFSRLGGFPSQLHTIYYRETISDPIIKKDKWNHAGDVP
jgi:hypothetical protein